MKRLIDCLAWLAALALIGVAAFAYNAARRRHDGHDPIPGRATGPSVEQCILMWGGDLAESVDD